MLTAATTKENAYAQFLCRHFRNVSSRSVRRRLVDLPILHDEGDALEYVDIAQRIVCNGNHICVGSRREYAQLALHVQQVSGTRSGGLNRLHRSHAELHLPCKILRKWIIPPAAARIRSQSNP